MLEIICDAVKDLRVNENSTDSPHPIRYRCEGKALGEFARGVSRLRRSGIYYLLLRPRKEGWLGKDRERAGQNGMPVWKGDWSGCAPSNASIIDRALWITTLPTLLPLGSCVI
jgi:hypothetical protein